MDTRPIGVFDSGLGGLTAVRQLRRVLPGEDIVYFGDTGRVPYGSRGRDIIVQYARQDIRFLLQQDVKFIIAACGTVSSTYPPEEAARLPVPFTGVVGATARAAVDAGADLVLELPVMLAVMLILTVPALCKGKLNRVQGILLLAIYAAFCAVQFTL